MAIQNPILPPKAGYVEVVDEDGNHVYKPTAETQAALKREEEQNQADEDVRSTLEYLLNATADQKYPAAEQLRRAIQMLAATLPEEKALEIATVYPVWQVGIAYAVGDIISYGTNNAGDPQLYKVVQAHTSQADWTPDATASLYDAFGLNESGYPIWTQPSGAHDAYNTGDIVDYNGTLYKSLIDGNVWSPEAYPAGWEVYTGT